MTEATDNSNVPLEELRIKVEAMKRMMENGEMEEERIKNKRKEASYKASIIDGNFLSIVFMLVLILIISVTIYAFSNLFIALRKRYPGQHSEL